MSARIILPAAICIALVAACRGDAPPAKREAAARPAATGAMCAEHGVLEAICTRCNPKLVPVFQAKGDWCAEHGFPESVCPICHPERGGKPAAAVTPDDAPSDGTRVRFDGAEVARLAGLEVVAAEARPGGARLEVVATIAYDPTRRAEINPRAAGVIRTLHVDVGDPVGKGARLVAIDSASVGGDRSRLRAADAQVKVAQATHDRERELSGKGVSSVKDLLAAEAELAAARAERDAAAASIGVVGGGGGAGTYVLTSPLDGVVTRRTATLGHMVDVDDALFEIVDTRRMRADLELPEHELGRVRVGQTVTLHVDGLGEAAFTGAIDYIAPEIDRATRTAKARVLLGNPDGALRANMYGRGQIALGAVAATVMVPQAAVQRFGAIAVGFVEVAVGEYEVRRVKLGASDGAQVEIVSGLAAGERVVTTGSFLLKTETLKGSIGAGCCD